MCGNKETVSREETATVLKQGAPLTRVGTTPKEKMTVGLLWAWQGWRCSVRGRSPFLSAVGFPPKEETFGNAKMAQRVKALAAKPDNLGSIPGTHTVEGGNQLLQIVLSCLKCSEHAPPTHTK